ncbi:MAG: nickel pincer cofactor biosynthesis protein LarB [Anaerolineae bacterium]|nr:nickel pincer cofactor biosynthesis protein LarB [Anaerolineae bacterium]
MNDPTLRALLEAVRSGDLSLAAAEQKLRGLPFEDIGFAHIDHHRQLRRGFPEVVYAESKTPEQTAAIMSRLTAGGSKALATRADSAHFEAVKAQVPEAQYYPMARVIAVGEIPEPTSDDYIVVVSAGTSDAPVAEEAVVVARHFGCRVQHVYDVGVAGLHRLLAHLDVITGAAVVIVVAGMEGALASVVGGLVSTPVVAVPTSVGYGTSLGGLAPLFTMLNSCASGVAVVNIDNGFGAAYFACSILRAICNRTAKKEEV